MRTCRFKFGGTGGGLARTLLNGLYLTRSVYVVPPPRLAAACGPDRIFLHWEIDPEAGEENWENWVTDFQIKRKSPGGEYQVIYTANKTDRSYTDTTVTAGVTYCYVVAIRYQDSCLEGAAYEVPSNEICLSTCAWPPSEEPVISAWIFTDEGIIGPDEDLDGGFRAYGDPSEVPASPWSFPSSSGSLKVRMDFENDAECAAYHDPPFNNHTQFATASAVITVAPGCPARLTVDWIGVGEKHEIDFERITNRVDGVVVANAHSPGNDGHQCDSGMGPAVPRSGSPVPPQQIVLNPGFHLLEITTTTGDPLYHWGAFYELEFTLQPE